MAKFITSFNTTAELTAFSATADFGRPHVSLTKDDDKVHFYKEDLYNGHDYVEIGGLKWATMNLGATDITDTGLYFEWGNPQGYTASQVGGGEGKKKFDLNFCDYIFLNSYIDWDDEPDYGLTKYTNADHKTVLDAKDDAAHVNWGGQWRMPTTEEFAALGTATTSTWTADYQGSGVAGMILTSIADNSKALFFPAAGLCGDGIVFNVDISGFYWSSSLYSKEVCAAYNMNFRSDSTRLQDFSDRNQGFSIRAVAD